MLINVRLHLRTPTAIHQKVFESVVTNLPIAALLAPSIWKIIEKKILNTKFYQMPLSTHRSKHDKNVIWVKSTTVAAAESCPNKNHDEYANQAVS